MSSLSPFLLCSDFLTQTNKSTIFVFTHPSNNKKYAAKTISNDNFSNSEEEFNILSQLNHPNIIKALEYSKDRTKDYLITELMDNGDLLNFLLKHKCKLLKKKFIRNRAVFEKFWRTLFLQIVDALIYMKTLGWAHLDIKPENILLDSNFNIKLIDFEYAFCCKDGSMFSEKTCGTFNYLSPEIKERKLPYDPFKSDIFSLGITFNNLLGACDLFSMAMDPYGRDENYGNLKENKFENIWRNMDQISLTKYFSLDFRNLIEKMLVFEPEKRISIEEVRGSEWFCMEVFSKEEMKTLFANL